MKNKFTERLEYILKNHPSIPSFTDYTLCNDFLDSSNISARYIFLHGLRRSDKDVEKFMFDVAKNTKICPVNVNNFRAGEKSAKIKMVDQLAMLFHGLTKLYGGEKNMHKKSIILSGHSQGSALAISLGQMLVYLFDMKIFCPIYCPIATGTSAAKMFVKYPGALDLLPNSDFMNFISDGFNVLEKRDNISLSILPFAVKIPSKLQKKLAILRHLSNYLSHFGEEHDTLLSYKSQLCPNIPKKFIYKQAVSIESCHEKWQNLLPAVKWIAKLLLKNITPILEHPKAISETIKAVLEWMGGNLDFIVTKFLKK